MIIQVQLAVLFFSACIVLLRKSSEPTLSATHNLTCLQYTNKVATHQLSATNYLNFFSITGGDTSKCEDVITAMNAVIKQQDYIAAGLLIRNRKIILSPDNNVGLDQIFDAIYDPGTKVYGLGKSAINGQSHLETKLREIFFYGACHAYQLTFDDKSTSCQPYVNATEKEKLEKSLTAGYKRLQSYREKIEHYDLTRNRGNAKLRLNIKDVQNHYKYLQNKDAFGIKIYDGVDPLLAAIAEAEGMFTPEWITYIKNVNGKGNLLKIRVALLYAEIPGPIIEKFFPDIKNHVDHMVNSVKNNQRNNIFQVKENNDINSIDDLSEKISQRNKLN